MLMEMCKREKMLHFAATQQQHIKITDANNYVPVFR
jgi:hypothetical protein